MNRPPYVLLLAVALAACHQSTEVRGIYVAQSGSGVFFPCEDPNSAVIVPDSALASRYVQVTPRDQGAYVRLRGVSARSGSIYSGRRYFVVQQILELRARTQGECPRVAHPVASVIPT
jgi:hypothetical protein